MMSLLELTFHWGVIIYLTCLWVVLFTLVSCVIVGFGVFVWDLIVDRDL